MHFGTVAMGGIGYLAHGGPSVVIKIQEKTGFAAEEEMRCSRVRVAESVSA